MFETEKDFVFQEFDKSKKEIIIQKGDQLSIIMTTNKGQALFDVLSSGSGVQQGESSLQYLVAEDSLVKLPTLGFVKIAGLTIRQAETLLEEKFSEFFQNPFVRIRIENRKIMFFFEEGTRGVIVKLPEENMTLIEALANVGGFSENSKSYKIKLVRGDINNNPQIYRYNIFSAKDLDKANFNLVANDIIYVETRKRYLSKFLTELQPYLILMSTSILVYSTMQSLNGNK